MISECPDGFFGSDCREHCSMTCGIPGSCDKVTGRCHGGCQAGWTGNICDKGYFKLNRNLTLHSQQTTPNKMY